MPGWTGSGVIKRRAPKKDAGWAPKACQMGRGKRFDIPKPDPNSNQLIIKVSIGKFFSLKNVCKMSRQPTSTTTTDTEDERREPQPSGLNISSNDVKAIIMSNIWTISISHSGTLQPWPMWTPKIPTKSKTPITTRSTLSRMKTTWRSQEKWT